MKINRKRLLNTFLELVRIDSLSKDERAVADWIKRKVRNMGFAIKEDQAAKKIGGNCGNLIVLVKGTLPGTVLLNAHIDTVVPGRGIKPKVQKDFVVSSGKTILGADNKAGVAVLLELLELICKNNLLTPNLKIIFTVAEEIGLEGAKTLSKKDIKADYGYVLDGGDVNLIVNQAPTQINYEVEITGKAAHAGIHPEKGVSAIKVLSHVISRLPHGRLDKETTANIGIVRGGNATNIISEYAYAKGEVRSRNRKTLNRAVEKIKKILNAETKRGGAKYELRLREVYSSFEVKPKKPFVKALVLAAKSLGVKTKIVPTGGGSDANIFNALGVPSIIVGVGADNVHTQNERLILSDFYLGAEILLKTLMKVSQ
jgi:tripeptide aminopeptidase